MARIFIGYRRDDSAGHVGWLRDRLSHRFGAEEIFRDIDTIPPGVDFVEAIEAAVGSCEVLLAVIGPRWLTAADSRGERRLDSPEDFVRIEIVTALERNIRVIPVLVQGARMPRSDELPPALARLARRKALELRDSSWDYDVDLLIAALETIITPSTQQIDALIQQLNEAEARKDWDTVIDLGERILKIDANQQSIRHKTVGAYNSRGIARYHQGAFNGAIADYDQALRLDPFFAAAYYNRGNAYDDQGKVQQAMADYNQGLRLDRDNPVAYYDRGLSRYKQRDLRGAVADFDQALRLDPQFVAAYISRGNARDDQGDVQGAMVDYNLALQIDPNNAVAYYNRGLAYLAQNDRAAARQDFERAAQLGDEEANRELARL